VLAPGNRPTPLALRRRRLLLSTHESTVIDTTGVLTGEALLLSTNGLLCDIIV